jgi:hypothetical protein
MKPILYLLLLVFIGCGEGSSKNVDSKKKKVVADLTVSRAQSWIQFLVDNYKSDYDTATSESSRDSIGNLYYRKIYEFLANHYIDSIKVHVDTVLVTKKSIVNSFHCTSEIVFRSELRFPYPRDKKADTLFNHMKSFRVNSDTMTNFCFSGDLDLWAPNDTSIILKILAFPCPQLLPRE